jgi:hypothetical protein
MSYGKKVRQGCGENPQDQLIPLMPITQGKAKYARLGVAGLARVINASGGDQILKECRIKPPLTEADKKRGLIESNVTN